MGYGLLFADTAVSFENAGWRKLTEFMANHIFSHIDTDECFTVVNLKVVAHEIWSDH